MAKRSPQVTAAWIAGGCAIVVGLIAAFFPSKKPIQEKDETAPSASASGEGQAVAIGDANSGTVVINAPNKPELPARMEVTDLIVDSYRKDHSCVLDFRIINRGDRSMSVSRVKLKALKIDDIHLEGALDTSAEYGLDISHVSRVGQVVEVPVSHSLEPGEVDRFSIVLSARKMPARQIRMWYFEPTVVTSEGDVLAKIVHIGLPWDFARSDVDPVDSVGADGARSSREPTDVE